MLKNFVSLCCKASGKYYHYYPAIGSLNFFYFLPNLANRSIWYHIDCITRAPVHHSVAKLIRF